MKRQYSSGFASLFIEILFETAVYWLFQLMAVFIWKCRILSQVQTSTSFIISNGWPGRPNPVTSSFLRENEMLYQQILPFVKTSIYMQRIISQPSLRFCAQVCSGLAPLCCNHPWQFVSSFGSALPGHQDLFSRFVRLHYPLYLLRLLPC